MLRAVLDANVIISALIQPKGASGRIVASLLEENSFELVLSPAILAEMLRALTYPKVRKYIKVSDEDLDLAVAALALVAQPVEGILRVDAVAEDADDNKYIEAALEGRAQFIVSGDRHLKSLKSYRGIRIVTPRTFLELL
ncbi:MAG: putative toxin-antitoxin system toxin component, PIN family [Deltaproteobacteria bacterium]|nr:putative toxin-antitoxin system toxin component, PIN family [Deltaproteobacteria bacterium]